jgi:hypothetical protein
MVLHTIETKAKRVVPFLTNMVAHNLPTTADGDTMVAYEDSEQFSKPYLSILYADAPFRSHVFLRCPTASLQGLDEATCEMLAWWFPDDLQTWRAPPWPLGFP